LYDDAHDDVLHRHLLLPKTENVKEIYISSVKVLLVCHPKGLFLFQILCHTERSRSALKNKINLNI